MTTLPVQTYSTATTPPYPDRSGWLTAFGIFQLVIAFAILGMIGLMFLGLLISSKAANQTVTPWRVMMQAVAVYGLAAVFFVVMGVGTIQAKRWARSLMLAVSWIWLVSGAIGTLMYAFMLPRIMKHSGGPDVPEGVTIVITVVMICFMFVIFIVLPLVMLLFYRAPSVKATCERRDPVARWTDRLPLPVLALFIMLVAGAVSFFMLALTMPYIALFGRFVTGWAGTLACLALAGWWAYLSWGTYRLRIGAWWATIISITLLSVSSAYTFLRGDAAKLYSQMGFPEPQSAQSAAMLQNPVFVGLMGLGMLAFIVFLAYLRKYYPSETATESA